MRAIIFMMLSFYFLTAPLSYIAVKESEPKIAIFALGTFVVATALLWHLTRKYRSEKRGFWTSVGLVLVSLFVPVDPR